MDAVYVSDWAKYCVCKNLTITDNYLGFLAPGAYKVSLLVSFLREERFAVCKTWNSPHVKNLKQKKKSSRITTNHKQFLKHHSDKINP